MAKNVLLNPLRDFSNNSADFLNTIRTSVDLNEPEDQKLSWSINPYNPIYMHNCVGHTEISSSDSFPWLI